MKNLIQSSSTGEARSRFPLLAYARIMVLTLSLTQATFPLPGGAQDYTWNDGRPAEPANHISFVRADDNTVAFEDWRLRMLISDNVGIGKRWAAVDVVMQQCYGGGFLNDVIGSGNGNITLTTSGDWDQTSWTIQEAAGYPKAVENFPRAWVAAANTHPNAGMRELAFRARSDDWVGSQSPTYTLSQPEHTRYGSTDAQTGGANDLRKLSEGQNERIFTVIGEFGTTSTLARRHDVNAGRVYSLMASRTSVDQAALLYSAAYPSIDFTTTFRPDGAPLPSIPSAATTRLADIQKALDGSLFNATPQTGDRLLLYTTGHGGEAYFQGNTVTHYSSSPSGGVIDVQKVVVFDPNSQLMPLKQADTFGTQREGGGQPFETLNPNMFGDGQEGCGSMVEIQLSFSQFLSEAALTFSINDTAFEANRLTEPLSIRKLPQRDANTPNMTPADVWQMNVPYNFLHLNVADNKLEFTFEGLDSDHAANDGLL